MTPPIGLGHDICHIPRIYKILISERGSRFIKRVLTPRERQQPRTVTALHGAFAEYQSLKKFTSDSNEPIRVSANEDVTRRDPTFWKAAQYVAGRFAAKEAVIKAFHRDRLNFGDIEIESGKPVPRLLENTSRRKEEEPAASITKEDEDAAQQDQQMSGGSGPPVAVVRVEGSPDPVVAAVSISHDGEYASAVCFYVPSAETGASPGAR